MAFKSSTVFRTVFIFSSAPSDRSWDRENDWRFNLAPSGSVASVVATLFEFTSCQFTCCVAVLLFKCVRVFFNASILVLIVTLAIAENLNRVSMSEVRK